MNFCKDFAANNVGCNDDCGDDRCKTGGNGGSTTTCTTSPSQRAATSTLSKSSSSSSSSSTATDGIPGLDRGFTREGTDDLYKDVRASVRASVDCACCHGCQPAPVSSPSDTSTPGMRLPAAGSSTRARARRRAAEKLQSERADGASTSYCEAGETRDAIESVDMIS